MKNIKNIVSNIISQTRKKRKKLLTQFSLFLVFIKKYQTTGGVFCSHCWCERAPGRGEGALQPTPTKQNTPLPSLGFC